MPERGKLLTVQFYSAALHRRADYLVYLPPGYGGGRRYPVYYLLHGMPGDPQHFLSISSLDVRLDNQISLHRARPMILVYPDGQIGGSQFSDSEWANTPSGAYDSYVIDVMHDVDHRFATEARRQDRVIAGCSAGAYGAVNVALHHLNDFGSVQSWSGYFIETKSGVFAHASRASLAYNSPLDYIRQTASRPGGLSAAGQHHRRPRRPGLHPAATDGRPSPSRRGPNPIPRIPRRPRLGGLDPAPEPDARPGLLRHDPSAVRPRGPSAVRPTGIAAAALLLPLAYVSFWRRGGC